MPLRTETVLGVGLAVEVSLLVQRDQRALVAADPPPCLRGLGSERAHALDTRALHPHRELRLATGTKLIGVGRGRYSRRRAHAARTIASGNDRCPI
eukprot:scaffold75668_cov75-Phaeocystis_antarctica.AAC.1